MDPTAPPSALPGALAEWLPAAGLSASGLAERLGINPSAVSHWMTGRAVPSGERLADIAAALNLSRAESIRLMELAGVRVPAPVVGDTAGA